MDPRSAFQPNGSAVAADRDERRGAGGLGRAHDAAHVARDPGRRARRRQAARDRRGASVSVATGAARDADDAGGRLDRAHRLQNGLLRDDEHVGAFRDELFGQRADGRVVESASCSNAALSICKTRRRAPRTAGAGRRAAARVRVRFCGIASKLAVAFDAGVRRSSHLESITDVLGSSCE